MSRRHVIAVCIALLMMLVALVPPLWIRLTGDEVVLEVSPVDPQSLFRGNYVDLVVDLDVRAFDLTRIDWNEPVYVVFDDARPANVVRVDASPPQLQEGEACIRGRARGADRIDFPSLEQFFVTPEEGGRLEQQLSSLVAVVRATSSCRAILIDLEPE